MRIKQAKPKSAMREDTEESWGALGRIDATKLDRELNIYLTIAMRSKTGKEQSALRTNNIDYSSLDLLDSIKGGLLLCNSY